MLAVKLPLLSWLVRPILLVGMLWGAVSVLAAPDPRVARFYEDALARYEKKDHKGAVIQLKNALQIDKEALTVQLLLGRVLLADGQPAQAEVAFTEALRLGVSRAEIVVDLAQSLTDQGKQPTLLVDPRFVLAGLPRDVQSRLILAKASAAADVGNPREALSLIDQARTLDPSSPEPWLAESALRIRERRFDVASAALDKAVALAGPTASAAYQRGQILHASGKLNEALVAYGKSLAQDPAHLDSLLARAGVLIDVGRLDEARRDVAEVRRLVPEEPRGAYLDALLADRAGDVEKSRQALKAVTALVDPVPLEFIKYKPQVLMLNGLAHYGLGERENAKPYLEAYLRLDPGGGVAKLLAQILIAEGNLDAAISSLETYLRARPGDAQAQALLASAHMAKGRPARAVSVVREALKTTDSPDLRTVLGLSMLRSGQVRDAMAELEAVYRKSPGQTGAAATLAGLYLQRGEPKRALEIADRLVKQAPRSAAYLLLQGHARLAAGDKAGAGKSYAAAAQAEPKSVGPQIAIARMDSASGAHDAAIKRLADLQTRNEQSIDVLFELAGAWERKGQPGEAQRWLEKAAEVSGPREFRAAIALVDLHVRSRRMPEALAVAKSLASRAPNDLHPQMTLAKVQIAMNDREAAKSALGVATRLANFDPADQVEIGLMHMLVGHVEGAAYNFEKALSARPDYLPAQAAMVDVEVRKGELDRAEARAKGIVQAHPKLAVGSSLLGDIAWARGAVPAATDFYRRAHQLQPGSDSLIRLQNAVKRRDGLPAALALGEQWLVQRPADRKVRLAQAGQLARNGQYAAARAHYERVLKDSPSDPDTLNNLANVLLHLDKAAALPVAERAVAAAPGNPLMLDTLGWVLFQTGQHERALQVLRDARLRSPGQPEIRYHLAAALAKAGRNAEARAELQAALTGSPRFEGFEQARELLKSLP